MADEIHLNDIGTEFRVTIKDDDSIVDISAATTLNLIILKPSGSRLVKNADLYTDGVDGIITYSIVAGDLDEIGSYKLQAMVEINGGTFYSNIVSFKVHCNI